MDDVDAIARDPRRWLTYFGSVEDGAKAMRFVMAAEHALPGLLAGVGAPVLDWLLEQSGFAVAWRSCEDVESMAWGGARRCRQARAHLRRQAAVIGREVVSGMKPFVMRKYPRREGRR